MTGDARQLAPGLAAWMPIRTDSATAEPPMVGAIWSGAEVRLGVDKAPMSAGEADEGRWAARRLGLCIGGLFTGCAQRLVEEAGERCGLFDAAAALMGWGGRWGRTRRGGRPSDVHEEAEQPESDQQELVKQRGGYQWERPFSPE